MLKLILFIYCVHYTVIECAIYDYKVLKLNQSLVDQQRQDTREACRLFSEDNSLLDLDSIYPGLGSKNTLNQTEKRRFKRDVVSKADNFTKQSLQEARKVEGVVDQLYEDLTEDGVKVTYRSNVLKNETRQPSGRRFDFAPAQLVGVRMNNTFQSALHEETGQYPFQPWPKKWPLAIVPYYIDTKTYDNELLESIRRALDYFQKATCIRLQKLREKPVDRASLQKVEWIYITNPMGVRQCVHSNEMKKNKGVQMVVLGYDCMSLGEILHEIMHVLGFPHEQTRPDRNNYVTIEWENIKPGYKKYFEIRNQDVLMNLPYDYASVLHYPPRAFSRNGQPTIRTLKGQKIGQREGLSEIDVEKVSLVYGSECLKRNREYLQITCPNIVNNNHTVPHVNVTQPEVKKYFEKRLWPYGIVNYRIRDVNEFSVEDRENIRNVILHIEKETCLVFQDFTDHPDEINLDSEEIDEDRVPQTGPLSPDPKTPESDIDEVKDNDNDVANDSEDDKMPKKLTGHFSDTDAEHEDYKQAKRSKKRVRRAAQAPSRRHANSLITFVRSPANGCLCPKSGDLQSVLIIPINGDCFNSANDLLHLVGHLLGLDHEHNMYNRDNYLTIQWDKLPQDMKEDLKNIRPPPATAGFPYDYQSVMHYPWLHVENGKSNIMYPNWNDGWSMGHWQGLSATDVKKLNHIYSEECEARNTLADEEKAYLRARGVHIAVKI